MDCALYFTHTYTERGTSSRAATTLLLDRSAVGLMEEGGSSTDNPALADVLSEAQLNGIPIETAVSDSQYHEICNSVRPGTCVNLVVNV